MWLACVTFVNFAAQHRAKKIKNSFFRYEKQISVGLLICMLHQWCAMEQEMANGMSIVQAIPNWL